MKNVNIGEGSFKNLELQNKQLMCIKSTVQPTYYTILDNKKYSIKCNEINNMIMKDYDRINGLPMVQIYFKKPEFNNEISISVSYIEIPQEYRDFIYIKSSMLNTIDLIEDKRYLNNKTPFKNK